MEFNAETYTPIIDKLFQQTDLVTVSTKKIRRGLQEKLGYDITSQKADIDALIAERFDIALAEEEAAQETKPKRAKRDRPAADHHSPIKSEYNSDEEASPKKRKSSKVVDEDARLAAKLQAEWNNAERPSRAGVKRKTVTPRKKKAKSKTTVTGSDDSGVEENGEKKKRKINKNNPFHAPMLLSQPLTDLLNETQLSRPETVKQIWRYIKANNLQDPNDGRYIICDEPLRNIFKIDKVHMFTMNKILSTQLYPIERPAVVKDEAGEERSSSEETANGMKEEAEVFS